MRMKRMPAANSLPRRYKAVLADNQRLQEELTQEKQYATNYWAHIVWLKTPEDMKPKAKPCPRCGSENVGVDGSVCCREFFAWCLDCDAMGPDADSENGAIMAWNSAGVEDLTVFDDEEEA